MELSLLLPQKPPMVMVDALVEFTELSAVTRLVVRPDNIFVQNGRLAEPGLVENIAQTAAAHAGHSNVLNGIPEAPLGYIATVDHLHIHKLPELHSTLETSIRVKQQVMNVTIIAGTIRCDGETIAECEMKIFLRN